MSLHAYENAPGWLEDRILRAAAVTRELMAEIVGRAGTRFTALRPAPGVARVQRLVEAGAWTDAAMALLELELPHWRLRYLVHEDGEWWCALGRNSALPDWLDDTVEAHHESLPLALLSALVRARELPVAERGVRSVPLAGPTGGQTICCDNFS